MRFKDKVAIITGSGRGIGKTTALLFAREGARVVVCDTNAQTGQSTVDEIRNGGGTANFVNANVSRRADVDALAQKAVESYGAIHILVNNAGIFGMAPILETKEQSWNEIFEVDLKGVLYCMQAVVPYMVRQHYGKIVNIASAAAFAGYEQLASYASAKAGVVQLTKVAAHEFGRYGINVNAVAPGSVITEMSTGNRTKEETDKYIEERKALSFLGRVGMPDDIARIVLFLASEDSGYVTGQMICADGGRSEYMA